ncbi:MAG: hypothetical protein V1755_04275 [Chloroflexota bacterium]
MIVLNPTGAEHAMSKRNIVHIEIPSANHEQAGKFYGDLFSLKITPMPEVNYALWEPEDGPGGGFSSLTEGAKVGEILIHVASDDIEAHLTRRRFLWAAQSAWKRPRFPISAGSESSRIRTGNQIAVYASKNPQGSA